MTRIGAWAELLKLGRNVMGLKDEIRNFCRTNAINSLLKEGWFDFLAQPRSSQDMCDHFGYTDMEFLLRILDLFVRDHILTMRDGVYQTVGRVEPGQAKVPRVFGPSMVQITLDQAASLPDRLRGRYGSFSDGIN
ncbi:MAG: hypothetical protein HXY34_12850, partial [Candidatus Thorarchaeota archaeon]|nr:hypothetical protein [Candidatus Thorarchaeota archaeon]